MTPNSPCFSTPLLFPILISLIDAKCIFTLLFCLILWFVRLQCINSFHCSFFSGRYAKKQLFEAQKTCCVGWPGWWCYQSMAIQVKRFSSPNSPKFFYISITKSAQGAKLWWYRDETKGAVFNPGIAKYMKELLICNHDSNSQLTYDV